MSNGDESDDDEGAAEGEEATALSPDDLGTRLDDAAAALEDADTEAELDSVEETLDDIAADLEAAELPEPDDEDEEDPTAAFEDRLTELRETLEDARGPYLEDVVSTLEGATETIETAEWTETGQTEVVTAVDSFLTAAGEAVEAEFGDAGGDPESAAAAVSDAADTVGELALDPDDDGETIEALLTAAETLTDDLEAAEEWSDLTIREQLDAQGFFDVLTPENQKDFPPEWNAIKIYAAQGESEPILTALEKFESDFMEDNALDALEQFAPPEAYEPLHAMAQKRAKQPIRILGRIGDERACETLHDFLGGGDVALEKITLRALGTIGSEDSTQPVANRMAADNPEVRSVAARSLGLIGDTRAIDPLADVLADDSADEVRASAAWALNQIGTAAAREAAADYAEDRSYIVQAEAEKAASG